MEIEIEIEKERLTEIEKENENENGNEQKEIRQEGICVSRVEQLKVLERLARCEEVVETALVSPVGDFFEKFPLWNRTERRKW